MNIGIIGIGYWGSKVLDEYLSLRDTEEIEKVFACEKDPNKLSSLSNVDGKFKSVTEVLRHIDAIHVCTDNSSHFEIAHKALSMGKDVLVEKPLTIDRDKAYDLVEKASENGQILQTGHIFRFANVVRKVKELYQRKKFGHVYYFTLRWTHKIDPIEGTDVLWDLLPHPIDILNFITGEWPKQVKGMLENYRQSSQGEAANLLLQLDGIMVNLQISWVDSIRRRILEVAGSKRSGRVKCVDQELTLFDDSNQPEHVTVKRNNTIKTEAENFINAIKTRENTFNSAIVGARTVDAIQMVQEELK